MTTHYLLIIAATVAVPSLLYVARWTVWAFSDGQRKRVTLTQQQQDARTVAALHISIDRARKGGR